MIGRINTSADVNDTDNTIHLMDFPENPTELDLLNYIVLNICGNVDKSKVYFKGAYMLTNILKSESRMTHDVDMSVKDKDVADEINAVLYMIGSKLTDLGVITRFEVREMLPRRSGGLSTFHFNDQSQETSFVGVDISYSETDLSVVDYTIAGNNLYGFSINRMLSDKIMASQGRKIWRRMKDFFDIYVISSANGLPIDLYEIVNCLRAREFVIEQDNYPFSPEKYAGLRAAWERNRFRSNLTGYDIVYPFDDVMRRYDRFVATILDVYRTNNPFIKVRWRSDEGCWREDISGAHTL